MRLPPVPSQARSGNSDRPLCRVDYSNKDRHLGAQVTYAYQLNHPPPLGSPDCQHSEITVPGYCANIIVYIPTSPTAVR